MEDIYKEATTKKLILIFSMILFATFLVSNVKADVANFTSSINSTDAFPGDILNFTLTLSNATITFNPVEINITLPLGLTWNDSASPTQSSISNQTIIWNNVGPLTIGQIITVNFSTFVDLNDKPGNYTINTEVIATYNLSGLHNITQDITYNVTVEKRSTILAPALSPFGEIILLISMVSIPIVRWSLRKT